MHAKDPDFMPRMLATGTASTMLPNRVSWYFNLRGPSVYIDTACSGSMTALDLACQSLRSEDASMVRTLYLPSTKLYLLIYLTHIIGVGCWLKLIVKSRKLTTSIKYQRLVIG